MKSKKRLYVVVLLVVILFLASLSPAGWFLFKIHRAVKQSIVDADSGFKRATNSIDTDVLRAWALGEIAKHSHSTNGYFGKSIPSSEIPDYIQNLYSDPPEDAMVQLHGAQSYLMIMWGGGFFHWGLYIGNTNQTIPFISDNPEYPYNFEWKPGIYYTREAKWDLQ